MHLHTLTCVHPKRCTLLTAHTSVVPSWKKKVKKKHHTDKIGHTDLKLTVTHEYSREFSRVQYVKKAKNNRSFASNISQTHHTSRTQANINLFTTVLSKHTGRSFHTGADNTEVIRILIDI